MAESGSGVAETRLTEVIQESEKSTGGSAEQELATKMLQIQPKRFYLDVKQNHRGRFIKITEVGAGGRKSRLLMSMLAATEFRDHLNNFAEFCVSLGDLGRTDAQNIPDGGRLKSEVMVKENRRYYLDLKENNRGRFLRVTQTLTRGGGPRAQVAIPAQGIVEMRDSLTELLDEYGKSDSNGTPAVPLPEGKQMRSENKMFYFDVGQNNRGVFMRVSEVKSGYRSSITIPEQSWPRFRDYFAEVCEKMTQVSSTSGSTNEPNIDTVVAVVKKEEKNLDADDRTD